MAYPTDSLAQVLRGVDSTAISLKLWCQGRIATMAAGNTTTSAIFEDYRRLKIADDAFSAAALVPGLANYAQSDKNDLTLDVAAEFTGMRNAIATARAWVEANFPANGGYLLTSQFSGGQVVDREFSPADTATYRTSLQSVVGAIN